MGPGHDTQFGSASDGWQPFVISGSPQFRWVDNEQIDPNGSQQIFSSGAFDAGIQQTIRNLQPGVYYWIRTGYFVGVKSFSGPNVDTDTVVRKVGVDPFGGTDPKSPNIIWGQDLVPYKMVALNHPNLILLFPARADHVTFFVRGIARDGTSGENRFWIDAICMEARTEIPPATLAPTATPVPPTATVRPTQAPTKAALKVNSPTPTKPPVTATPENSPTPTVPPATPTRVGTPTPSPTARFARPMATPAPQGLITLNAGLFTGLGLSSIFGSFIFFAFGVILSKRPS